MHTRKQDVTQTGMVGGSTEQQISEILKEFFAWNDVSDLKREMNFMYSAAVGSDEVMALSGVERSNLTFLHQQTVETLTSIGALLAAGPNVSKQAQSA